MDHSPHLANNALCDAIDATVAQQLRRRRVPGAALAIVEGQRIVHARGFGQARPGGGPPTPQTPFYIGSLTKSMTALAVMQLVEAGRIELDAPVRRYLPWFRVADAQASDLMTVRHLLNQTSGLPTSAGEVCLADFDDRPGAAERQARALASLRLARPVGAAFEYSNANYNLLGLIIEAAGDQSYASAIESHIFAPLEMRHSTTDPAAAERDGLAAGYRYWFARPRAAPDIPVAHGSLAAGMILSCVEDVAHYLIAMLNDGRYGDAQLLSTAGLAELHHGAAEFKAYGLSLGRYGMGWNVTAIGGQKLLWHSGILPHFFAYMALLPEQRRGVVLLCNADNHWMSPVLTDIGTSVTALLAGEQPAALPFVGLIPWLLRGLLLLPLLQAGGLAATVWRALRPRLSPGPRLTGPARWGLAALRSSLLYLLPALALKPLLGQRRGYLRLYMPDYYWSAILCGGLAAVGGLSHAGLALRAHRRRRNHG